MSSKARGSSASQVYWQNLIFGLLPRFQNTSYTMEVSDAAETVPKVEEKDARVKDEQLEVKDEATEDDVKKEEDKLERDEGTGFPRVESQETLPREGDAKDEADVKDEMTAGDPALPVSRPSEASSRPATPPKADYRTHYEEIVDNEYRGGTEGRAQGMTQDMPCECQYDERGLGAFGRTKRTCIEPCSAVHLGRVSRASLRRGVRVHQQVSVH